MSLVKHTFIDCHKGKSLSLNVVENKSKYRVNEFWLHNLINQIY